MQYEAKKFNIGTLSGISNQTMQTHLGLYEGYVKNVNFLYKTIQGLLADKTHNHSIAVSELQRRLGFEYGGMKNHEYYFNQFENGRNDLPDGRLKEKIIFQWKSVENWMNLFRIIAKTRGVGWAILYHDPSTDQLVQTWVDEQHVGHLVDCRIILALDMWEHAYLRDYLPGQKGDYVESFFNNLNWQTVANRLV